LGEARRPFLNGYLGGAPEGPRGVARGMERKRKKRGRRTEQGKEERAVGQSGEAASEEEETMADVALGDC
jgi:hypothetical protein